MRYRQQMFHMAHTFGWHRTGIVAVFDPAHYWPRHFKVTVDGVAYHSIDQETIGL